MLDLPIVWILCIGLTMQYEVLRAIKINIIQRLIIKEFCSEISKKNPKILDFAECNFKKYFLIFYKYELKTR